MSETCRVLVGYGLRPETEVWKAVLRAQIGSTFAERPRRARHGGGADLKRAGGEGAVPAGRVLGRGGAWLLEGRRGGGRAGTWEPARLPLLHSPGFFLLAVYSRG